MSVRGKIQDTLADYALGYDENDFDLLASCFAPDAVIFFPAPGLVVRGLPAVRAQLEKQHAARGETDEQSRHLITNVRILEESSDEVLAVSFWIVTATSSAGVRVSSGWYRDRFVPRDGRWVFRERTIHGDSSRSAAVSALAPPPVPAA
jgi:ketosteroid isomerase-like protein